MAGATILLGQRASALRATAPCGGDRRAIRSRVGGLKRSSPRAGANESRVRLLRTREDLVAADAQPLHVSLAWLYLGPVAKGGAAIA